MSKKRSFNQKASSYWATIKANPEITATELYNKYKGTKNKMRKKDMLSLRTEMVNGLKFADKMDASNVHQTTKDRIRKNVYGWAKKSSVRGRKIDPPSKAKPRRTMAQTTIDTFKDTTDGKFEKYEAEGN